LGLNLTAKSAAQKGIMSGQQTTEIQSTGSSVNVGLQVSLRDYFAAAALQGNLAGQSIDVGYYEGKDAWNKAAEDAYAVADAMLKARGGK